MKVQILIGLGPLKRTVTETAPIHLSVDPSTREYTTTATTVLLYVPGTPMEAVVYNGTVALNAYLFVVPGGATTGVDYYSSTVCMQETPCD